MHSAGAEKPDVIYTKKLIRSVPALQQIYEEHVQENDILLPHVFFGQLTRFVVNRASTSGHDHSIATLMNELENGLEQGPEEVREVIRASFIENLCGETEAINVLKPLMREKLKAGLSAICGE